MLLKLNLNKRYNKKNAYSYITIAMRHIDLVNISIIFGGVSVQI